ncbi:MAG: MBOAT family O-acyltransferase [Clostridia bacterium]
MVFSSVLFVFIFLPLTVLFYYIAPKKYRNLFLFLVSLLFYAWGEPIYIVLMLFSSVVDYTNGLLIDKYKDNKKLKRTFLIISVVINLSLLCVFKYADFFISTTNSLVGSSIDTLKLGLPLGISFYTFQTMSYSIDVYRGVVKAQKNFITFGTYVSLFPQLIAGPIVRYQTVEDQLTGRKENLTLFTSGLQRFIIGLGKKMIIANNCGYFWKEIQATMPEEIAVSTAWLGVVLFCLQLYFDFSGYSDMAIGLGKMFGFEFLENFNYPYISKSVSEFWRRWHISLGTWFKEYVYIPLGGNRKGTFNTYRNLAIVWVLTGLWHGASGNYVMWGVHCGIFIILERAFLGKWLKKIPAFFSWLYTIIAIAIGMVYVSFDAFTPCVKFIKALFGGYGNNLIDRDFIYFISCTIGLLILAVIGSTPVVKNTVLKIKDKLKPTTFQIISMISIFALFFVCISFLVSETYNPFLYFRF